MVKTFNDEEELKRRLTFLSNRDAWELTSVLESAHRRVKGKFGRSIEERLKQRHKDQTKFVLRFEDIFSFEKVIINQEEIESSKYDIDKENGTIEFTDDDIINNLRLYKDNKIIVYYVPNVYKDLEIYYAMEEIVALNMVETNDTELTNRHSQIRNTIKTIIADINRSMPPVSR